MKLLRVHFRCSVALDKPSLSFAGCRFAYFDNEMTDMHPHKNQHASNARASVAEWRSGRVAE